MRTECGNIIFRMHAIQRMFEREISMEDVQRVLSDGVVIENYPDDTPYPSRLIHGWCGGRPIHVVSAYNADENTTIIITVYEPDPDQWDMKSWRRK